MDELIAELIGTVSIKGLEKTAADINKVAQNLRKLSNQTGQQLGKQENRYRSWSQRIKGFAEKNGAALRSMGRYLTVLGATLTALVTKSGQLFVAYEKGASDISTLLSGGLTEISGQMAIFDQGIKQLSVDFDQTTDNLQRGLYDILSASIAPADALQVLAVASEAATAGLTSVGVSADALTTILNAYQLEASQATEVSDKLWAIVKRGKVTYEELAGSIGLAASTAAVAGLRFEELGALIATATRAGVRNRIAMTGARSTLLAFLKNTDEQKEAARKFGFELNEVTLAAEGLEGVIKKLAGANDLNRAATAAEIVEIFQNRRALNVLAPVLQDVAGFTKDIALLNDSAGLSALAFSKRADDLGFQLGQLSKQLKILMIDFFEPLVPLIRGIADAIGGLLKWFENLNAGMKGVIATITLLSGVLLTLTGTLAFLLPGLLKFGALLSGPIVIGIAAAVAVLVGAGGLIAAISAANSEFEDAGKNASEFAARLKQTVAEYESTQKRIEHLISKYDELKLKLAEQEKGTDDYIKTQKELKKTIDAILRIVPDAGGAWNDYGVIIDIDKKKVEEFTEAQKENLKITQEIASITSEITARRLEENREAREEERKQVQADIEFYTQQQAALRARLEAATVPGQPLELIPPKATIDRYKLDILELDKRLNPLKKTLAELNKEGKEHEAALLNMASGLKFMSDQGRISTAQLNTTLDSLRGLRAAYNGLVAGAIEPTKTSIDILGEAFARSKKEFPDFRAYIDDVREASRATINWGEVAGKIGKEMADLEAELETLWEAGDFEAFFKKQVAWLELLKRQNSAITEQGDEVKKLAKVIDETAQRMLEFEGFSIQSLITYLELQRDKFEQGSNEWLAYEQLKVKYTDEAAAQIIQIWGNVTTDFKAGLSDMLQAGLQGWDNLGDAVDDFGKSMVASLRKAFADSIIEKLGFDNLFKENILGLEGILGGFGQSIASTFGGIFSSIGGGGAGVGATFDLASSGITGAGEAAEYTLGELKELGATVSEVGGETWVDLTNTGLVEAGEAAEYTTGELQEMGIAAKESSSSFASILPPVAAVAWAVTNLVTNIEGLKTKFKDGKIEARDFTTALGEIASPVTSLLPDMGRLDEAIKGMAAGFAILGPPGAIIGGLIGAFGGAVGIKHGTSGLEELGLAMDKIVEKGDQFAEQTVARLRQLTHGERGVLSEIADAEHRGGGELLEVLEMNFAGRQAWFNKYIVQSEAFSDAQLKQIQDMLGLYENAQDRQVAQESEAFEASLQSMGTYVWEWAQLNRHQRDEIGGWEEAFKEATDNVKANGGDFREAFIEALRGLPDITDESMQALLDAFDQASGTFEKSKLFTGGIDLGTNDWREWSDGIATAVKLAGSNIKTFTGDIEGVIDQWLAGEEFDLEEALLRIPGMTRDLAESFKQEAEALKDQELTDFGFSDENIANLEKSMAEVERIVSESGGLEGFRERFSAELGGLGDATRQEGRKLGLLFSEGFDIEGGLSDIDLSETFSRIQSEASTAGYDAGAAYKEGFEEGASGSGILGDVMWSMAVVQEAINNFSKWGEEIGKEYKEGFAKEAEIGDLTGLDIDSEIRRTGREQEDIDDRGLIETLQRVGGSLDGVDESTGEATSSIFSMAEEIDSTNDFFALLRSLLDQTALSLNIFNSKLGATPEPDPFGSTKPGRGIGAGFSLDNLREIVASLAQAPRILAGALTGVPLPRAGTLRAPEIPGGLGGREITVRQVSEYHLHFDSFEDEDRVVKVVRDKLRPALEDDLQRTGRTLEDLLKRT